MKILQKRGECIDGCGRLVRKPGTECRKCRRSRIVKGKRLFAKLQKEERANARRYIAQAEGSQS